MFTSQREEWADPRIIALVELDVHKMRVRIILTRKAIRERMLELERSRDYVGERRGIEHRTTAKLENMKPGQRDG
jgi:hypothetical protein